MKDANYEFNFETLWEYLIEFPLQNKAQIEYKRSLNVVSSLFENICTKYTATLDIREYICHENK